MSEEHAAALAAAASSSFSSTAESVEAHKAVYEKEIDGFAVAFHMISWPKIGTSTVQSRACAGVAGGTYLFALPGSPGHSLNAKEPQTQDTSLDPSPGASGGEARSTEVQRAHSTSAASSGWLARPR